MRSIKIDSTLLKKAIGFRDTLFVRPDVKMQRPQLRLEKLRDRPRQNKIQEA